MAVKGSNDFDPDEEESELNKHGSIRKVLHSLVGTDSLLGKSAKMLDRPKSKLVSPEPNLHAPYLREYAIISEYNFVVERRIPGVYVIPSANSELLWFGVIFIRSGMYRGGIFRFTIHIPENFPNCSHPKIIFETRVFHPSIDSDTLEVNLESVFSHWTKGVNYIWQIIDYTKSIFLNVPLKANSNRIAAQLFEIDKEEFARQVKLCVDQSQKDIYKVLNTEDSHYLKFEEYDEIRHGETKRILESAKSCNKPVSNTGLSWVKRGSLKPFSASPFF